MTDFLKKILINTQYADNRLLILQIADIVVILQGLIKAGSKL